MLNTVAEATPGRSDRAAGWSSAARPHFNSPPEAPKNGRQINPNLNDYHSDPMQISTTFRLTHIPDWWCQQEEMHFQFAVLTNEACDISSIIPHGVRVEASFFLRWDVISWRLSTTIGETLHKKVFVRQITPAQEWILAGTDQLSHTMNTENNSEMKTQAEQRNLLTMAKVLDFLEMWQGSHNLHATQKETRAQTDQMTAMGYILDTEEMVKASWSLFQHHGAGCIYTFRMNPLATTFVCKGPPWRTNSNIGCPSNPQNQPSSSWKWWEQQTGKHCGHWRLT